ncbi:MAG: hypothetical protein ACP5RM_02375 [Candidatus Micrarchaeia archaeon]
MLFDSMFFGKPKEANYVEVAKLKSFIEKAFESKMQKSAKTYYNIAKSIKEELGRFESICADLDGYNGEPDTELIGKVSTNTLKEQKSVYAKGLINIAKSFAILEKGNTYDSMVATSAELHSALKKMLETNLKFKTVVMAYGNQMQALKRPYGNMESLANALDAEIERMEPKAAEYRELMALVDKLEVLEAEYKKPEEYSMQNDTNYEYVIKLLESAIAKKENEAKEIRKSIDHANASLAEVLAPLGRAARKHDHLNNSSLYSFVANPINNINKQNYEVFKRELEKLYEEMQAGKVDEQGNAIYSAIKKAMDPKLLEEVENARILAKKYMHYARSIEEMKARLSDYNSAAAKSNEQAKRVKSRLERRKDIIAAIGQLKDRIERLVEAYYSTKIEIKLDPDS